MPIGNGQRTEKAGAKKSHPLGAAEVAGNTAPGWLHILYCKNRAKPPLGTKALVLGCSEEATGLYVKAFGLTTCRTPAST